MCNSPSQLMRTYMASHLHLTSRVKADVQYKAAKRWRWMTRALIASTLDLTMPNGSF